MIETTVTGVTAASMECSTPPCHIGVAYRAERNEFGELSLRDPLCVYSN